MKNSNKNILNTLSYLALIIVALLLLVNNILPAIGIDVSGPFFNVLGTIKEMFVLIVIGIAAYNFTSGKAKWITILFWIAIIVYIVSVMFYWF